MRITKELVDKEIELTKMKLDAVGGTNLDLVLGVLSLLASYGISATQELFEYWPVATLLIVFVLGLWWNINILKLPFQSKKRKVVYNNSLKVISQQPIRSILKYQLDLVFKTLKGVFLAIEVLLISAFLITLFRYLNLFQIRKEYLIPSSNFFVLFYGGLIFLFLFTITKTFQDIVVASIVNFPNFVKNLEKTLKEKSSSSVILVVVISLIVWIVLWLGLTLVLPIYYLHAIITQLTKTEILHTIVVVIIQGIAMLFVIRYHNRREITISLSKALFILINLRELLLASIEFSEKEKARIEMEFFEAIKYSQITVDKILGIYSFYFFYPNYLYQRWLIEKSIEQNTQRDEKHAPQYD